MIITVAQWRAVVVLGFVVTALLIPGAVIEFVQHGLRDWLEDLLGWQPSPPDAGSLPTDKVVHVMLFMISAWLIRQGWPDRSALAATIMILVLVAVLTELAQHYIPGRGRDWFDLLANATGITLGLVLAEWRNAVKSRVRN